MTKNQLKSLEDQMVNAQLLEIAIEAIEKIRHRHLPDGLQERWVDEMKEEAELQVSQHSEDRESFISNA